MEQKSAAWETPVSGKTALSVLAGAGQASCHPLLPLPETGTGGPFCIRHGWEVHMNCHL